MEQFSKLVLALCRASRDLPITHFQVTALNLIKPSLDFDSCLWTTSWMTPTGAVHSTIRHHPDSPTVMGVAGEKVGDQKSILRIMQRMVEAFHSHAHTLVLSADITGININVRHYGVRGCLFITILHRESRLIHGLTIYRTSRQRRFSVRDKNLYRRLVPHLAETLATNWSLYLERLNAKHGGKHRVIAIADRKGNIHYLDTDFASFTQKALNGWAMQLPPRHVLDSMFEAYGQACCGSTNGLERLVVDDALIIRTRAKVSLDNLTPRELMVARHAAEGLSHKEIARLLLIAPSTVRNHIQSIHKKLNVHNILELAGQLNQAN